VLGAAALVEVVTSGSVLEAVVILTDSVVVSVLIELEASVVVEEVLVVSVT